MKTHDKDMNVPSKTPDEIKSWLNGCKYKSESECEECNLIDQCETNASVLAYIQQLESRLAQVERERDAAVHDLKLADRVDCDFCKHQYGGCTYDDCQDCSKPCPCGSCRNSSNYEWRGVCEANTEEGTK